MKAFPFLCLWLVPLSALAQSATVTLTCPDGPPIVVVDGGVPPPQDAGPQDSGTPIVDAGLPDSGPPPVIDAGPPPSSNRPPQSKGTGFYVVGRTVYDGNGAEFTLRGTNKTHQDNWGPGLGHTKSNTTRWNIYFSNDPDRAVRDMQSPNIGGSTTFGRAAQVPGFWDGTCKSDSGSFNTMVDRWVRDAKKYQAIERYMILNIANEWGSDHRAWRDAYVSAIPRIRNAGWHGAIMVDAPGCGQDALAIVNYGQAVFDADPEKNVVFDFHIYGNWCDSTGGAACTWNGQHDLAPTIAKLYGTGLAIVAGEFGPGRNIGPSPTLITPQRVIDVAEQYGMGWLSWSWEDNDQANAKCSNNSFCHTFDTLSDSIQPSNLTDFGKIMVDKWTQLARTATVFTEPSGLRWFDYLVIVIFLALVVITMVGFRKNKKKPPRPLSQPGEE